MTTLLVRSRTRYVAAMLVPGILLLAAAYTAPASPWNLLFVALGSANGYWWALLARWRLKYLADYTMSRITLNLTPLIRRDVQ